MNDPLPDNSTPVSGDLQDRRLFLKGVGKWSGAAIIAAVAGSFVGTAPEARAGGWINRRGGGGGGWINGGGGGGGGWINGGGGGWINRR